MNPETARALLDRHNAGQINLPPEQIPFLESIAAQSTALPNSNQGGMSSIAPIDLNTGGNTSIELPQNQTLNVPSKKIMSSGEDTAPLFESGSTASSAYTGKPRPNKEEPKHDVPESREAAIKLATESNVDAETGGDKAVIDKYKQENLEAQKAGNPLPYPDLGIAEDKKETIKPETKEVVKPKAAGGTGSYIAPRNPLLDIDQKWFDEQYGTAGKDAVEATPESPKYSPSQKAQVDLLNKQIGAFDATLKAIADSNSTDETKERLHFEALSRRQKLEDMRDTINQAALKNGVVPGKPGSAAVPATPGIMGRIEQGVKAESALNQSEANAVADEVVNRNKLLTAKDEELDAARKERMTKTNALTDEMWQDAKNLANYKEDPERFWHSRNTMQRVGTAIAILLGGIGQGLMRGGDNPAVTKLNNDIDRDIAAQRATYDAKKSSFAAKNSMYGKMMDKYKDPELALAASKLAFNEQVSRRIEEISAKTNSERVKLNGDKALIQLDKIKSDAAKEFATRQYGLLHPTSGSAAPKLSDKQKDTAGVNNQLTDIINRLDSQGNVKPYDVKKLPFYSRTAAGFTDWLSGEGTSFNKLPQKEQDLALHFKSDQQTISGMAAQLRGSGAEAEGERLVSAANNATDPRQLAIIARDMLKLTQAKGVGQGGKLLPTPEAPLPTPGARTR